MSDERFFAERLRELRERAGLSQPSLAERSGLGVSTVRQFEYGLREPTYSTLVKLARGLGVSLSAFDMPAPDASPDKRPTGTEAFRQEAQPRKATSSIPQRKPHGQVTPEGQPPPLPGEPRGERGTARRKKPRG